MRIRLIQVCLLLFLLLLTACTGRSGRMLRQLEHLEEMNRTDQPLRVDSVLPLVRYYDHWWHPSLLRLRAYYMLGSAYRDQGEAPAALHYYNIATEKADTLHPDSATAATLFRVYGQMAMIYEQQNLPYEELDALKMYRHYALKAGDTLNYIIGLERDVLPYYHLDDSSPIFSRTDKVRRLYLERGLREHAARACATAMYVSLLNADYSRARHYMDIYEQESGLFDKDGNIEAGLEQYYENRGLYHLGTGETKTAEYYFRKLLDYGYVYEGCKGLLSIYQLQENADSIVKYSALHEEALLKWRGSQQAEAIIQSSAMYNYERNQNIAEQKAKDAALSHYLVLLLLSILLFAALVGFLIYSRARQKSMEREIEYGKLAEKNMGMQMTYRQQCQKLVQLQRKYKKLKEEAGNARTANGDRKDIRQEMENKEKEIACLTELVKSYQKDVMEKEDTLKQENIVVRFKEMAQYEINRRIPSEREWKHLVDTYRSYMPHIYTRSRAARLTERELHSCILTQLDFSTSELTVLMDVAASIISNAKASANTKLFGEAGASSLRRNLKKCAYFQV